MNRLKYLRIIIFATFVLSNLELHSGTFTTVFHEDFETYNARSFGQWLSGIGGLEPNFGDNFSSTFTYSCSTVNTWTDLSNNSNAERHPDYYNSDYLECMEDKYSLTPPFQNNTAYEKEMQGVPYSAGTIPLFDPLCDFSCSYGSPFDDCPSASNIHIQNSFGSSTKGYIGLTSAKSYGSSGTVTWSRHSYATRKLPATLTNANEYRVTMKISRAAKQVNKANSGRIYLPQNDTQLAQQVIDNFGIYFSASPLGCQDVYTTTAGSSKSISNFDEGLYVSGDYLTKQDFELVQTGGEDGNRWMTISGIIDVNTNIDYITIGNFQEDWTGSMLNGPAPNTTYYLYHYVDEIKVEKYVGGVYNDIMCPNTLIDAKVTPVDVSSHNKTGCCFKIEVNQLSPIDIQDGLGGDMRCVTTTGITGMRYKAASSEYETQYFSELAKQSATYTGLDAYQTSGPDFGHMQTSNWTYEGGSRTFQDAGTICIDDDLFLNDRAIVEVEFQIDGNWSMGRTFVVEKPDLNCVLACDGADWEFEVVDKGANENGNCCYDLYLNNNSDEPVRFYGFQLDIESTSLHTIIDGVTSNTLSGFSLNNTNQYQPNWSSTSGTATLGANSQYHLSTICVYKDASEAFDASDLSLEILDLSQSVCTTLNNQISCDYTECCQNISVTFSKVDPEGMQCCYEFGVVNNSTCTYTSVTFTDSEDEVIDIDNNKICLPLEDNVITYAFYLNGELCEKSATLTCECDCPEQGTEESGWINLELGKTLACDSDECTIITAEFDPPESLGDCVTAISVDYIITNNLNQTSTTTSAMSWQSYDGYENLSSVLPTCVGVNETITVNVKLLKPGETCAVSASASCESCQLIDITVDAAGADPCCHIIGLYVPSNASQSYSYASVFRTDKLPSSESEQANLQNEDKEYTIMSMLSGPQRLCNYSNSFVNYTTVFFNDGRVNCSATFELPPCSNCPCPDDINDVFDFDSGLQTDPPCEDNCAIFIEPKSDIDLSCFDRVEVDFSRSDDTGYSETLTLNSFNSASYCLLDNMSASFIFQLYQPYSTTATCTFTKDVNCDLDRSFLNTSQTYCEVGCPEDWLGENNQVGEPWTIKYYLDPPNENCYVEITFLHRKACPDSDDFQDIHILSYGLRSDNQNNPCNVGWNETQVYQFALEELIRTNPMEHLPVTPPPSSTITECNTNWRVSKASCWVEWDRLYWDYGPEGSNGKGSVMTYYEPCDSDCCMRQFLVCKQWVSGTLTTWIEDQGLISTGSSCTTSQKPDYYANYDGSGTVTVPCDYRCDLMDNYSGTFNGNPKQVIQEEIHKPKYQNSFELQKIHFKDMIELRIKNKNATGFKVDIRDLNGREIEVYDFKLDSNGHISYFIDISNYKNGTYIYTVTVDGMYLKTYKFQVLK